MYKILFRVKRKNLPKNKLIFSLLIYSAIIGRSFSMDQAIKITPEGSQQSLSLRSEPSGVDPTALIWIFNSEKVSFEGNTVSDLDSFCKTLVKVNANSKNISGISKGVAVISK